MTYRKIPFGYQMRSGGIYQCQQESEVVIRIFRQYITGASYGNLVNMLREQPIRYYEGRLWNKNMIARILEDRRYTGTGEYPCILSQDMFDAAKIRRTLNQGQSHRSPLQKLMKRLSGQTPTVEMERQVLGLLNSIVRNPDQIIDVAVNPDCLEKTKLLQEELQSSMENHPIQEEAAKALIYAIAAEEYSSIGPQSYETERLKRIFKCAQPLQTLEYEFLSTTVSHISVKPNGNVWIQLKNYQIIGEDE